MITEKTANVEFSSTELKKYKFSSKPASKANSEELRQRLLADWSDEDNAIAEEIKCERKTLDDCATFKSNEDKTEDLIDLLTTPDSVQDDFSHLKKATTKPNIISADNSNNICSEVKSMKRIRNIPKKDRRDLILKEFNSEVNTTKSTILRQDSVESYELTNKLPEDTGTSTVIKESKKIVSCFDFNDEDDYNESNKIGRPNIKKKLKANEKSNEELNLNEKDTNLKYNQLSEEIEILLKQTVTTISNVDALQNMNTVNKEDNSLGCVKGLPIKERGKRIFKSRNRTISNEENNEKKLEESGKSEVIEKVYDNQHETRDKQEQPTNTVQTEEKLIDIKQDSIDCLPCDKQEEQILIKNTVIERTARNHLKRDKQENSALDAQAEYDQNHFNATAEKSCKDKFSCALVTKKGVVVETRNKRDKDEEEDGVAGDGSSTISDADAEFGSPTSMLDDDRVSIIENKLSNEKNEQDSNAKQNQLPKITLNVPGSKSIDSEQEDEDEEEIESPPHEELSGNELEEEMKRIGYKKSLNKSDSNILASTSTAYKQSTKQQKQEFKDKIGENQNLHKNIVTRHVESQLPEVDTKKNLSIVPLKRKRSGHMKITPCRQINDKIINKIIPRENSTLKEVIEDYDDAADAKVNENNKKDIFYLDDVEASETKTKSFSELENNNLGKSILTSQSATDMIHRQISHKAEDRFDMEETNKHSEKQAPNVHKKMHCIEELTNDSINTLNKVLNIDDIQIPHPESRTENSTEIDDGSVENEGIVRDEKLINKIENKNINKPIGMKRKHCEKMKMHESKISRNNWNDNYAASKINIKNDDTVTKMLGVNEEGKPGSCTTVLPSDAKLLNSNGEKQIGKNKSYQKIENQQQEIVSTKVRSHESGSQTPELKEINQQNSKTENMDHMNLDNEENQLQPHSAITLSVDDGQISEMQEQDENPKFLAVPTHPIAGYNETFLLCTVENNQYKPIDGVPLYLDQDLNQLQPVPLEALEGQPVLIVNQAPAECHLPLPIKTVLPAAIAEEETQMLCIPTQVTDVMAEAAAATVSTVMTPALVKGNESNLQLSVPMNATMNTEESTGEAIFLMTDEETETSTAACGLLSNNAIIVNVHGQQIILEEQTLAQLLSNPEGSTQLVTDDGTEFVMTRELLAALEAQQETQQTLLHRENLDSPSSQDILAVALAGSDFYGHDMLQIETSQTLQLVCNDGFHAGSHLTPPITAQTSETNALLNQTPIMSTLELPTTTSLVGRSTAAVAAQLKSHDDVATPNLEDSLAVIGVTAQPSSIPTSLELPITVTNPAIAPKISLSNVMPVTDAVIQFAVQTSSSIIGDASVYSDS